MLVLALDTTTRAGSVAVARDGLVVDLLVGNPGSPHAERLPGDLLRLLGRAGFRMSDVGAFAVAIGPGSFTGLRIGIAAIQGCAFAAGRPVVGVSTLEALALAAPGVWGGPPLSRIGVWMDAQRAEVFSALYEIEVTGPDLKLDVIEEPSVGGPAETAARWRRLAAGAWFPVIGDGAERYRDALGQADGARVTVIQPPPLAPVIAQVATRRVEAGDGVLPHAVRPLYVRRPDAELARDRRSIGS